MDSFHFTCNANAVRSGSLALIAYFAFCISTAAAQAPETYSGSCSTSGCHDGYARAKSVHSPVAEDSCDACHEAPEEGKHLFEFSAEGAELCFECHDEDDFEGDVQHSPFADGDCLTCHNPHSSEAQKLLTSPSVGELCAECHDELTDDLEFIHGPVAKGDCTSCHNPHAAERKMLLIKEPMELCLSCHNAALKTEAGTIEDIAARLAANPNHHGPVAQKDCLACHGAHGSDHSRLLVESYPRKFYAPYEEETYGLCFECHDSELVEEEETDEATGFRDGVRNLHFLHVNRPKKGRTCRACHDPHATTNPKAIATSVRFGTWDMPLKFQQTENGGSCATGCHQPKRYDRESPVLPPKPKTKTSEPLPKP